MPTTQASFLLAPAWGVVHPPPIGRNRSMYVHNPVGDGVDASLPPAWRRRRPLVIHEKILLCSSFHQQSVVYLLLQTQSKMRGEDGRQTTLNARTPGFKTRSSSVNSSQPIPVRRTQRTGSALEAHTAKLTKTWERIRPPTPQPPPPPAEPPGGDKSRGERYPLGGTTTLKQPNTPHKQE